MQHATPFHSSEPSRLAVDGTHPAPVLDVIPA